MSVIIMNAVAEPLYAIRLIPVCQKMIKRISLFWKISGLH